MIYLNDGQWRRLYKEVFLYAMRRTSTKSEKRKWTARDHAQEAVQRAFERLLRLDPPEVKDLEGLHSYLCGAVRSELGHHFDHEDAQRKAENLAARERQALAGKGNKSAEQLRTEVAEHEEAKESAQIKMAMLKDELTADAVGLELLALLARGEVEPEKQAARLGVPIEEIYNARKRRQRARDRVNEMYRAKLEDEEKKR